MSDYDRGVYAPENDAPLAFDPRQARGGGPAPFSLIVSVMVLLMIVGGAYMFYRHGVRKAGEAPQVVGAPVGETRTPPPSGAQAADESAGLQVYKTESPSSTGAAAPAPAPAFAPAPEQPQPLPAARPAAVAIAPLKGEAAPATAPAPPPVRVAQIPAPAAKPAPLKVAAAKPPALRGPAVATADDPSDDDTGAAAAPAPKPAKIAKPSAAAAAAAAIPSGGAVVQIGAFADSAQADKTWGDLARAMPTQMHGKTRKVETTTKDGKTFYRAYVGGFASRADAASFCASLKAAGKPCFVK